MASRLRLVLVFLVALTALSVLAGKGLTRPNEHNHFTHLAQGWLEGRLHLSGKPPNRNDWGRVVTLELRDGRTFRGFPCRTESCRRSLREEGKETWRGMDGEWVKIDRSNIGSRHDTWFVTFPPGPALLMLPFVAIWGLGFWDVLFTVFAAALIPAVLVSLLDRVRGRDEGRGHEHLWLAAAWTLGSPACFVGAGGGVWFTGQTIGALLLTLAIADTWELRRPGRAGLWLALLMATRPPAAIAALLLFAIEWWRQGRPRPALIRAAIPVAVAGAILAMHNYARFESVFEFGHRYLDIAWQPRMQEHGMFASRYLGRNLHCMFLLPPRIQGGSLQVSVHGMSLLLASPWLLVWLLSRQPFPWRRALPICAVAAAVPALLYQNTGQMQFSYRFAMDWLPLAIIAIGMGGGARGPLFRGLVIWAVALNLYGAWMFVRAPGKLMGLGLWPYGRA